MEDQEEEEVEGKKGEKESKTDLASPHSFYPPFALLLVSRVLNDEWRHPSLLQPVSLSFASEALLICSDPKTFFPHAAV